MEQSTNTKCYCPDCGTELQTYIFQQDVEPFETYLYFHCSGRCHVEACREHGLDPAQVHSGTPKLKMLFNRDLIDIEQACAKVREKLARELELREIEKITDQCKIGTIDGEFIKSTYQRVYSKYPVSEIALVAVYLLGQMHGIRAERKRRANSKNKSA